jgi:hypothetical protein
VVRYFRARVKGPELAIEDAVARSAPMLFQANSLGLWTGGSIPLGAGRPDLVVVACDPTIAALANAAIEDAEILAYLRAVGRASSSTISARTGRSEKDIAHSLESLEGIEAVEGDRGIYTVGDRYREVLPEVMTIEAKVSDWRTAIQQAARNRIFAHRSFVALPSAVAKRIQGDRLLTGLGLGLLSVDDDGEVKVLRWGRRRKPRVWVYYYRLAFLVANDIEGTTDALHGSSLTG